MTNEDETYKHLSADIYEWMNRKDAWGAREAQALILKKIDYSGKIETDKPLESVLAIVEKHKEDALKRNIDLDGLNAFYHDDEGYRTKWESSPEYQAFTQELLKSPDFPYTQKETSLIGIYQRENNCKDYADIIIDRILLRKILSEVKNPVMRESIWYTLTLNNKTTDLKKYLNEKHHGEATRDILAEIKSVVLPEYSKFLDKLREIPNTKQDRGIKSHGIIAYVRQKLLEGILEYSSRDWKPIEKQR